MPTAETETMPVGSAPKLSHLKMLEAESIHIFREVAAEFEKPVMLSAEATTSTSPIPRAAYSA